MRILFTIHHEQDPNSGAAGVTVQLASALAAQGHQVHVFSWSDLPERLGAREREALFPAFVAGRVRRAVQDAVDVVDASTADAWIWLLARETARARYRGPLVVTRTHGLEHTFRDARVVAAKRLGDAIPLTERVYHGFWRLREVEVTLRLGDAMLFLNRADRDRAVDELRVPESRAFVVPNGIPDAFVGMPVPVPRAAGEPLRLVHIGAPDARKGTDTLAAALGPMLAERADVRLLLLGSGPPGAVGWESLSCLARPRVRVVEHFERRELPQLLAGGHVLLHPSRAEGFSLALVEAMACGLAPVASATGAAPELLGDYAGVLVEPGDTAQLRRAVSDLLDHPRRLEELRRAARDRVQDLGWSRVARETADLYAGNARRRRSS